MFVCTYLQEMHKIYLQLSTGPDPWPAIGHPAGCGQLWPSQPRPAGRRPIPAAIPHPTARHSCRPAPARRPTGLHPGYSGAH